MNHVIIRGRLGKDPEVKFPAGRTPYARLRLAVNGGETVWVTVLAFGQALEQIGEARKGQTLTIWGRLARSKRGELVVIARAAETPKPAEPERQEAGEDLTEVPF